jgi:hypothetical protein
MLELVSPDFRSGILVRKYPMTVGTLIQKLQACDPEKPVRLCVDGYNDGDLLYFGCSESEVDVWLGCYDFALVEELQ